MYLFNSHYKGIFSSDMLTSSVSYIRSFSFNIINARINKRFIDHPDEKDCMVDSLNNENYIGKNELDKLDMIIEYTDEWKDDIQSKIRIHGAQKAFELRLEIVKIGFQILFKYVKSEHYIIYLLDQILIYSLPKTKNHKYILERIKKCKTERDKALKSLKLKNVNKFETLEKKLSEIFEAKIPDL